MMHQRKTNRVAWGLAAILTVALGGATPLAQRLRSNSARGGEGGCGLKVAMKAALTAMLWGLQLFSLVWAGWLELRVTPSRPLDLSYPVLFLFVSDTALAYLQPRKRSKWRPWMFTVLLGTVLVCTLFKHR
jgi:hypothetical protein